MDVFTLVKGFLPLDSLPGGTLARHEVGGKMGDGKSDNDRAPVYSRQEVFVVGGQPTITYNPRPGIGVEQTLREYLEEKNRILCITGPSKCGKTVLVREVIGEAIRLSGGDVKSLEEFWGEIVDTLGEFTDESGERTMVDASTSSGGAKATIKPAGVGFEAGIGGSAESGMHPNSRKITFQRREDVAKRALRRVKRPIVIDDFHHVEPDVQREIVRGVKDLVFDGVPVILIAVPHHAADAIRAEPEMTKRVEHLEITPWSQRELAEIASRGFDAFKHQLPR